VAVAAAEVAGEEVAGEEVVVAEGRGGSLPSLR
jgi:hypothetical protein